MIIAFTTSLPREGFSRLSGHQLLSAEDFAPQADVLVATFDYPVTRALLERMPQLKLVANFGVGFNNIDLDACRERGIRVTNTPEPVIEPTAELAFSLMLSLARRTVELDHQMRSDTPPVFGVMNNLSHTLYGSTLGIIGLGRIGMALARRAEAFGMRIIYHNRHIKSDCSYQYVSMDDLLTQSDFVSLNLPYTPQVHHLIDEVALSKMKRTAYLINTARGAHIDEQALVRALQQGLIAGAAMDVYEHEPAVSPELLTMPNVVLSPHVGTGTWEGRIAMCENVSDNILAFIDGREQDMNIVL